jgi:hypothetical protein
MATITGTSKSETLSGTGSADTISGKGGDDILSGFGGADILDGGPGDDLLKGGSSKDQLRGGRGDDTLLGGGARDILTDGDGADLLDGGTDNDKMSGGKGADIYIVDSAGDQVIELAKEGIDELRSTLESYTLGAKVENLTFIGLGDFTGTGNFGANRITGGDGDDTLDGKSGNDRLEGRSGRDTLSGGQGRDTLLGGADRDRLEGEAGNDLLKGGSGRDTLTGGTGDDTPDGGAGSDTATFSGFKADYTISIVDGKIQVTDENPADGDDGTDLLTSIEFLQFKDGKLPAPTKGAIDLATLNGTKGFTLIGIDESDRSGFSVSDAGDVNGDGFDDVIVGAPDAENNDGESYVVFGKPSSAGTPSLELEDLDGNDGFRLVGIDEGDESGFSVSSAGDVNGDGLADLIIGARGATGVDESGNKANRAGESYVVFGNETWEKTLELEALDGTNGFRLIGIDAGDQSGSSVSSAGDVNGDGFADLIIGAPTATRVDEFGYEQEEVGESYLVFGKTNWGEELKLATLEELKFEPDGVILKGMGIGFVGESVSTAGDVNGDGFADLIIGASNASTSDVHEGGKTYVVFGKSRAEWAGTTSIELETLDGENGFILTGIDESDHSGETVSTAGDVNDDGFADLIIGARDAESNGGEDYDEGESYVVFGKASWTGALSFELESLTQDGRDGFRLVGIDEGDRSGTSVSSAGDVNGDGFADLIVGAPAAESTGGKYHNEGESYLVFGKASWTGTSSLDLATLDGENGFRLIGIGEGDRSGYSVSSTGDVNGDGFADLIVGAPGAESAGGASGEGESYVVFGGNFTGAVAHLGGADNDTLTGTADAETFVGGTGDDTMIGGGGEDSFQGGAGDDTMQISTLDFRLVDGGHDTLVGSDSFQGGAGDTLALEGSGLVLDLTALADSKTRSIERIDITGTGNNTLTLKITDVLNLSDESNELLVLGDAGDVVNQGPGWTAATTGGTQGNGTSIIDGETYQIFTADKANLLVDTDMTANV